MIKDRSESRSGLDKSIRKNGAGQHNWGSLAAELELESAALEDEAHELEEDDITNSSDSVHSDRKCGIKLLYFLLNLGILALELEPKEPLRSASLMSEEEIETAKQYRKHAFKGQGILFSLSPVIK
jgi:hypothetical protein